MTVGDDELRSWINTGSASSAESTILESVTQGPLLGVLLWYNYMHMDYKGILLQVFKAP